MEQNRTIVGPKEQWTSQSGVTVTFVSVGHKHKDDGGAIGLWTFRFATPGGKTIEERIDGQMPEAEIAAHGQLFVIQPSKARDRLRVEEREAPKKLSEDGALATAEKHAKDLAHDGSQMYEEHGIYTVHLTDHGRRVLRVRIGAYTRRLLTIERGEAASKPSP